MAGNMKDYLNSATPDYSTTTLSVNPDKVIYEKSEFNQVRHEMDDGSSKVVTINDAPTFKVVLGWKKRNADIQTIFDFFNDATKAKGMARTFKWEHPTDGNTYVAQFASNMTKRIFSGEARAIDSIAMIIVGYV